MRIVPAGVFLLTQIISHCWCSVPISKNQWSPDFLSQASQLSCEPGAVQNNVTFLHGTKSGSFTKLGKVSDLEVCMLLCCELERCQAAFLAGNYCYSVTCFTTNHCATAPALNNKWQPVVAFVKRINKVVHVQPVSKDSQDDVPKTDGTAGEDRGSEAEASSNNGVEDQSKKFHLKTFFEEEGKQKEGKSKGAGLTITAEGKADGVQLEELQNKVSLQRNVAQTQRYSSKHNLVSAAVATCLLAFILSGCAVAAAKIRKRKESVLDYTPVPDTGE
ncbi:PREDICTED: uncharacterized protein LOC107341680 [Acropora digitifera]|uniref:uncharacterized protein LOC107341680 n=1 Tax=Acropora digitifera TaxID=70779 RepID=UPI00077A2CBE|nr:PREDICTED: uncharacterized protein LOC107341680 [Acropora digitifera]